MSSPDRIVRWEVLKGLPGDGPVPKHFQIRPWREGFVVRFWNTSGTNWVGNFGGGGAPFCTVFDWDEADMVVVGAAGALYFLRKGDSNCNVARCGDVTSVIFDENRSLLVCARVGGRLTAYARTGDACWSTDRLGVDQIKLKSCTQGVIVAQVDDYDGAFRQVKISATDGANLT